ncbi:MAG: hypothetical protein IJV54_04370 [Bacteroidales bacterium]|nr:hypothetical protein [Bacteroidales bacterium]
MLAGTITVYPCSLFVMEAGYAMGSWNKWMTSIFNEARKYDHCIFTLEEIEELALELRRKAFKLRGGGKVVALTDDLDSHQPSIALYSRDGRFGLGIRFVTVKNTFRGIKEYLKEKEASL